MSKHIPLTVEIHKQLIRHWFADAADPSVINAVSQEGLRELEARYPDVFSLRPNGAFNLAVDQYLAHIGEPVGTVPRKYVLSLARVEPSQPNSPFSYLSWSDL